jgi:alpha-galactosidase
MKNDSVQVVHTAGETPASRFVSGKTIYDEAFIGGTLVSRYWSECGQVWPEMHLPPEKLERESREFPMAAFELTVNGEKLNRFTFVETGEKKDPTGLRSQGVVSYTRLRHSSGVEVDVNTRLDGSPFIVRWLDIVNKGKAPIGINSVYPMAGRVWAHDKRGYQDPQSAAEILGAAETEPFAVAYNHLTRWGTEGDFYFEPLAGEKRFDGQRNGKSGWSRPAFWLRHRYSGKTFVCEFAYSGNWEFRATGLSPNGFEQAGFAVGIPETAGEYCRVLDSGEAVATPLVYAGIFAGTDDTIVQAAHDYVRHTVMPKVPEGREIEIEANHRGYLCDRETGEGIRKDIDVAAAIGAELYVIDAGWYGEPPNRWWNNTGDWYEGEWMGCTMRSISDYAHEKGMLFGLWIEIEAAGSNSKLRREHPDWLMQRDGKLLDTGRALDLARKDVSEWIEKDVIERAIKDYGLDMYRIDHNHSMGIGGNREHLGMKENLLWRYYDNLYEIFDHLLMKYPNTVFQNCAGGGGRLDFGMLHRFHNNEMSDWMRPPREVKIYSGLTMAIPPDRFLRTFGTETSALDMEPDIDFQLRMVTVCRPIFRGIAPSLNELNKNLLDKIKGKLELFRKFLRPVLRDCNMYHHTAMQPVMKPADFGVYEYAEKNGKRSFIALFRLNMDKHEDYFLKPRSLKKSALYRVYFDNSGETLEIPGIDLLRRGLSIDFYSSEIITFEEIQR